MARELATDAHAVPCICEDRRMSDSLFLRLPEDALHGPEAEGRPRWWLA
ncbi:MAG: hypothetical protein ABW190_05400 [Rhizobacter sp.]